jgi:hypothetical protein
MRKIMALAVAILAVILLLLNLAEQKKNQEDYIKTFNDQALQVLDAQPRLKSSVDRVISNNVILNHQRQRFLNRYYPQQKVVKKQPSAFDRYLIQQSIARKQR